MAKESSPVVLCERNAKTTIRYDSRDSGVTNERDLKNGKDIKEPNHADFAAAEVSKSARVHVLAVDDNSVDRKIIEMLVKSASFAVTSVDSGAKALEALSTNRNINLIITDYCMPEMSGYDLLKRVKEATAYKHIPVVIMSSENAPDRIQKCIEEGAEEFLLKPVRLPDVKRLKSYVFPSNDNTVEQMNVVCKKRKFNSDGYQVQSPERGPRLGSVTVA
ncbi:hypothetical protein KP509_25G010700 [Ceratopteris richardii]|uniref:Response regulatory domain-containing protein n=1 Tax=Ceratopteris richardii TaxID=49495 RepID=A0A8T2RQA8_CERRI|nr:hypothetical protein KP509_25G010700 [Ceratopteris richardii]